MPFQQRLAESKAALEPLLARSVPESAQESDAVETISDVEPSSNSSPSSNEDVEAQPVTAEQQPPALEASESGPQESPEPVVAPLKKLRLKELVKLFAEVLRENDLVEDIELGVENGSSEDPSGTHLNGDEGIAQIWKKVTPMVMETVSVNPEAQLEFHERWRSVDDLYKLFIPQSSLGNDRTRHKKDPGNEIHACVLRWRLSELQRTRQEKLFTRVTGGNLDYLRDIYPNQAAGPLIQGQLQRWDPFTEFRVLICCCLAVDEDRPKMGEILEYCYRLGVLKQPHATSTAEYMNQISIVVECFVILSDITPKEVMEGLSSWFSYGGGLLETIVAIDEIMVGKSPLLRSLDSTQRTSSTWSGQIFGTMTATVLSRIWKISRNKYFG